jgi:tetratricopeptide (TPR) repeat protein
MARRIATILIGLAVGGAAARGDDRPLGVVPPRDQDLGRLLPGGYPEIDAARDHLKPAVVRHKELPHPRLLLALLFFSVGNHDQGAAILEQAAVEAPARPEVYAALGKLAIAERRFALARLAFEKARGLEPPDGWTPERKADFERACHDGLATLAEARQDWEAFRAEVAALLESDPKNGAERHRLARALFKLRRRDDALAELRRGSEDDPSLEPAEVAMSRLYAQDGKPDKAFEWLEKAEKEHPNDTRVRVATANYLLARNRPAEADAMLQAARDSGGDSPDLKRLSGLVARCLKRYDEAEKAFQSLSQEAPGDFFTANQLALTLAGQDDPAKRPRALQLAEVNVRAFPKEPEALATLGWTLFRSGRAADAERVLRALAARGPIPPDTAYYLGVVLDARGNVADGRKLIESAVKSDGTFFNLADARTWLEEHPAKP